MVTRLQRLDSVQIRSNMARLGRIGIVAKGIVRFLANRKGHHRPLWEQVDANWIDRCRGKKAQHVAVEEAGKSDAQALPPALEAVLEKVGSRSTRFTAATKTAGGQRKWGWR